MTSLIRKGVFTCQRSTHELVGIFDSKRPKTMTARQVGMNAIESFFVELLSTCSVPINQAEAL